MYDIVFDHLTAQSGQRAVQMQIRACQRTLAIFQWTVDGKPEAPSAFQALRLVELNIGDIWSVTHIASRLVFVLCVLYVLTAWRNLLKTASLPFSLSSCRAGHRCRAYLESA